MTTKSSVYNIKPRFSTSSSVNNMTTNGNDMKTSRISVKRPLSTTNFYQNNSPTNGCSNNLKKRTLQTNNFFHSKLKSNNSNEQVNGHSPSPPLIFHAIAPVSSDEINKSCKQIINEQKDPSKDFKQCNDESKSTTSRRIARVLAHSKIKTMSTDPDLIEAESSCSEDENQLKSHSVSSSIDADADESDNGNSKNIKKSRRLQKTRKTNNSSIQKSEVNNSKDELQRSSSNENENPDRRLKSSLIKKIQNLTTTTTSDDDTIKQYHRYHPLDNIESNMATTTTTTNESNLSSPIPTMTVSANQPSVKKVNRFQVKSIRKSQQQQILLANASAAKSSNDDDCSVPNLQLKPSIIGRKYINNQTTDGENTATNTDNHVNSALPTLSTIENGHHRVRFQVIPHGKHESPAEEEKLPNQTATAVALPTPVAPSSTASVQGEDDEEEEAIAKSPDNRFIKYAKEIGRGAFKTVYRGLDTETSVAVAWCELQDFAQFDKHERVRFKEEAEMLKKLQHPNIVRFYDFWEETNPRTNKKVIILVTELMTSGSLKGYIRKFKGQKEDKRINVMKKWCRQILKGLAYLHSRNPSVIHRDLKCDNVFISSTTGCVKIGDLGLATFKTQTFAKSMRGTMEFMAPEMFDEKYDELVDIYSFGLCMLEMITGEYPYIECKGPTAVIKRVTAGLKPDCYYKVESEDVREVIDCCIRTKKEERLSVQDLLQHSFFLDDNGLRIDFVRDQSNDLQVMVKDDSILFKLKITDKTKRKALWDTEHEALRFRYNFTSDTPEKIVDELIKQKKIFDDDKKFVIQSIKDRLRAYEYEQIDRKAGVFSPDGKRPVNQPSHLSQQQQVPPPQQPTIVIAQPQVAPVISAPAVIQQPPIEIPQQPIVKPVAATEPIPISQLSELSSSVSGSGGSLEVLNEALKKTLFTKTNTPHGTSTPTIVSNDISDPPTPLINQDDSKPGNDTTVTDQQQIKESTSELTTNIFQLSTPSTSQTQSQPSTMSTNHQLQISSTPLQSTQQSQSCSYTVIAPSSNDINKQIIPPSSSSIITTESIDINHRPISPSHTNETIQSSIPSDTQAPILGSLKQLHTLLQNTFKNPTKSVGSDTETTKNDEISPKTFENETDEQKRKLIDLFNTSNPTASTSQPNTSSLILPKSIQQVKSQPTIQFSTDFDPFISPEKNIQEIEILLKTPNDRSTSNDDTIVASTSSLNDSSEIKLMIADLSKTLLNRMNIIENKIDEHRNQTIQINNLLTKTVLPSLIDLTDIIHQTPNIDPSVWTKLENIQTNIRSTQQQQTLMKDLMDI